MQLSRAPEPEDVTACKIRRLLRAGDPPIHTVVQAVETFRHARCSITEMEQGLGSYGRIKRAHPDLGPNVLQALGCLYQAQALLPAHTERKKEQRFLARIEAIEKQCPRKTTGRHMFFKALVLEAQRQLPPQGKLSPESLNAMMRLHGSWYRQLSSDQQDEYAHRAQAHVERELVEQAENLRHLKNSWQLRTRRLSLEAQQQGIESRLSACRFTNGDLNAFVACLETGNYSASAVAQLRQQAGETPNVDGDMMDTLTALEISDADRPLPGGVCDYMTSVAECRSEFQGFAFLFPLDGGGVLELAFLYATQKPVNAVFQVLQRVGIPLRERRARTRGEAILAGREFAAHAWSSKPADIITGHDLPSLSSDRVQVTCGSSFFGLSAPQ